MTNETSYTIRCLGFTYLRGRKVRWAYIIILALLDWVLLCVLGREKRCPPPPLDGKRIAIAKIDHLGDVLMITPLLAELRKQSPSNAIHLVLGSWCKEVGELLVDERLCDGYVFYDAIWLNQGPASAWAKAKQWLASFRTTARYLRDKGIDILIDLRPFSPNTLFLARYVSIPHKIGFGLRGCSFLLQQEIPYDHGISKGQLCLHTLPLLNLKEPRYEKPVLNWRGGNSRFGGPEVWSQEYVAVHPFSREEQRMIPEEVWIEILSALSQERTIVLLGAKGDLQRSQLLQRVAGNDALVSMVGKTSVREAIEYTRTCVGFLGVDSVFAHVALAFDRPTQVLGRRGISDRASFPDENENLFFVDIEDIGFSGRPIAERFLRFLTTRGLRPP